MYHILPGNANISEMKVISSLLIDDNVLLFWLYIMEELIK